MKQWSWLLSLSEAVGSGVGHVRSRGFFISVWFPWKQTLQHGFE